MSRLDVLVVAPHPDDAEFAVGGTLLRLRDAGLRLGVVDLSRGERGTYGSAEERAREAALATDRLGLVWRQNLGLPDGSIRNDARSRERLTAVLDELRPRLVLAPPATDPHPDHVAGASLARACIDAQEHANAIPETRQMPPFVHFDGRSRTPTDFAVDVTSVWAQRQQLMAVYASQMAAKDVGGPDYLRELEERCGATGALVGVARAEGFALPEGSSGDGPPLLAQLALRPVRRARD